MVRPLGHYGTGSFTRLPARCERQQGSTGGCDTWAHSPGDLVTKIRPPTQSVNGALGSPQVRPTNPSSNAGFGPGHGKRSASLARNVSENHNKKASG
mmetsp:Transcript_3478/g.6768  ORF Transcript_3478/g.6768 Transcript_3478/m.6768 type:complete len:97 (+) Transcript_3478:134-424(+)